MQTGASIFSAAKGSQESDIKLPPLNQRTGAKSVKPKEGKKRWVTNMPPTLGYKAKEAKEAKEGEGLPEYDEEKFLVYSVF